MNYSITRTEKAQWRWISFVRNADSLIPIEVKANDSSTPSLNKLTAGGYTDIKFGIKLCNKNIGFNGKFYTFPYFLTFSSKEILMEKAGTPE